MNEKSNHDTAFQGPTSLDGDPCAFSEAPPENDGNAFMFFQRSDILRVIVYGAIIGVSAIAQPLQAIVFGNIFTLLAAFATNDSVGYGHFIRQMRLQCGYIMIIGAVKLLFTWLGIFCWMLFGESQQQRARLALSEKVFSRKIEWYDTTKNVTGKASQVNRCVEELRAGTSETLALIIQQVVSIIALLVTAMCYSWLVLLVIMASAPFMVAFGWFFGRCTFKAAQQENQVSSQASKVLDWVLGSPTVVRLFNAKLHEAVKFYKLADQSALAYFKLARAVASNGAMLKFFGFMIFVQGFWFGNAMIMQHKLKINQVFTCFSSCLGLVASISQLAHWLANLNKSHAAAKAIKGFLENDEDADINSTAHAHGYIGDIRFDDVSFKYASRPDNVLKHVSFAIKSKEFTSIIGQSGLGKSTIANLILRFYTDFSGRIFVGRYNIEELDREWLADNVTYMQQSTCIFNDTFRNNIAIAVASKFDSLDDVPDLLINEACSFAGLGPVINSLPNGMSTMISTGTLSGGQKQRVSIARAKLRDTAILIMDESLSALDSNSKAHLFAAIQKWRKGKMTINITHELGHITPESYVVNLEKGAVIAPCYSTGTANTTTELVASSPATLVGSTEDAVSNVDYIKNPAILQSLERKKNPKSDPNSEEFMGLFAIITACFKMCDCRLLLVVGLVASLLDGLVAPVFNFCFSKLLSTMVDAAVGDATTKTLAKWLCVIIGISIGGAILQYLSLYILAAVSEKWIVQIRKQAFTNVNEQDMSFFDKKDVKPAELTALIMNDTRDLRNLVADFLSVLINLVTLLSVGMIWLIALGWRLALVGIAFVPLILLLTGGYARILQSSENKYKSAVAVLENEMYETIGSIKTVIGFNATLHFKKRFAHSLDGICRVGLFRAINTGFGVGLSELCNSIATGTVVYYGMQLVGSGVFSRTQMILVMTLFTFTIVNAGMLLTHMPDIARGQRAGSRVLRLIDLAPLPVEKTGPRKPLGRLQGLPIISFNNVQFLYNTQPVLTNATFEIYQGEIVAIVGESGSGKSTVASLMTRLYGVSARSIYVGKQDICDWDVEQLRETIAVVPQTPQFFQGTIYDNLVYGIISRSRTTKEQVMEALRQVNMHDFVKSLAEGLQTVIGEGQNSLISGGQLQRLSIARAILRRPKVLLLDECTSSLDPDNTRTICDLIVRKLAKEYTIVMITHDPAVSRIATKTLLVDKGIVAVVGQKQ